MSEKLAFPVKGTQSRKEWQGVLQQWRETVCQRMVDLTIANLQLQKEASEKLDLRKAMELAEALVHQELSPTPQQMSLYGEVLNLFAKAMAARVVKAEAELKAKA